MPKDGAHGARRSARRFAVGSQVHVHLMSYMREQVLSKWMGRKQAQEWVCSPDGMRHCYEAVLRRHKDLSKGDFPDWHRLSEMLRTADFNNFYKPSAERSKKLKLLNELMETDIPLLIEHVRSPCPLLRLISRS